MRGVRGRPPHGVRVPLRAAAALLGLGALALAAAVRADPRADPVWDALAEGVSLELSERVRWEHWEYFDPGPGGGDPDDDFGASQLRATLRWEQPRFAFELAGQYVQLVSVPDDAVGSPGGALGTGGLYYVHAGETSPEAVQLARLNLELRRLAGRDLRLRLGRFGYASAREADSGIPRLEALKKSRLADRLVGTFGWSHFQRAFDGAWLRWDPGPAQLSLAAFRPTEGGFEDGGTRRIDDIDVALGALTLRPGTLLPHTELQLFAAHYDDERFVRARVDDTGLPAPDRQDLRIESLGGHLAGVWPVGPGEVDALAWGVWQTGDWYEQRHRAWAVALEAGYAWPEAPAAPWLRVGAFRGSGDRDPADGRHGTFFQMLPTARLYSLTTVNNLMNSTDLFAELRLAPAPGVGVRLGVHDLRLTSRDDLWYAGAGATQARGTIFGYGAGPRAARATWAPRSSWACAGPSTRT